LQASEMSRCLKQVVSMLPSLDAPTMAHLYGEEWFSGEIVVNVGLARDFIPKLLSIGAEGVIRYPLNKVVQGPNPRAWAVSS